MPCDPLGRAVCVTEGRGGSTEVSPDLRGALLSPLPHGRRRPEGRRIPFSHPPSAHSLGGVGGTPSGALRTPVITQEAVGSGAWPPLTHMVPASARGGGSWQ